MAINVNVDSINKMNIILNDGDCSDVLFDNICDILREDGLVFTVTKEEIDINQNSSLIISLDQQYSSGAETIIFAPYNNTRLGYSDSLALSMKSAFLNYGVVANKILCGKVGYREDNNGIISNSIPTITEESIDSNYDSSFVVISLGTQVSDAEIIAKSIESGLARQSYYIDNYDAKADLIYRSTAGESVKAVAEYFNSSAEELSSFNNLINRNILESQAIINPNIKSMIPFYENEDFYLEKNNTKVL